MVPLNNTFLVIRRFEGRASGLDEMMRSVSGISHLPVMSGAFRIRCSVNNQFVGVNKDLTRQLEHRISLLTRARIDRVNPQTEYWFLKRSEGIGFFCRRLGKRRATEKNLHQGELRPEFASLMCSLAGLERTSVAMDPFSGYGAIPSQIAKSFPFSRLYVSDLNRERVHKLRGRFGKHKRIVVSEKDALQMKDVAPHTIDAIITDPPWGYYEDVGDIRDFYDRMFQEFNRVLREDGIMVILSARKQEIEASAAANGVALQRKFDTLVNGKKAGVYVFGRGHH